MICRVFKIIVTLAFALSFFSAKSFQSATLVDVAVKKNYTNDSVCFSFDVQPMCTRIPKQSRPNRVEREITFHVNNASVAKSVEKNMQFIGGDNYTVSWHPTTVPSPGIAIVIRYNPSKITFHSSRDFISEKKELTFSFSKRDILDNVAIKMESVLRSAYLQSTFSYFI